MNVACSSFSLLDISIIASPFKVLSHTFFGGGKAIITFIQHRLIKLFKCNSKDIYNVTNCFYSNKCCSFELTLKKSISVSEKKIIILYVIQMFSENKTVQINILL